MQKVVITEWNPSDPNAPVATRPFTVNSVRRSLMVEEILIEFKRSHPDAEPDVSWNDTHEMQIDSKTTFVAWTIQFPKIKVLTDQEWDVLLEYALNQAVLAVQKQLGVESGDWAGVFFSGEDLDANDPKSRFNSVLKEYAQFEYDMEKAYAGK